MKKILQLIVLCFSALSLTACIGCYNPTGCDHDDSPYFYTTATMHLKGLPIPAQSKLVYQSQNVLQKEQQQKPLKEKDLTDIALSDGTAIVWGGVPVKMFIRFFNSEMVGYSVYRDQSIQYDTPIKASRFVALWDACGSDEIGIEIKDPNDWSFNPENMKIIDCGVNIQRRSQYNQHSPWQDEADKFLQEINAALQKLPKQQDYPVIRLSSE